MFGFPDIDTNDEHVRPNAARAYRARMEFLGTSLLCIEHGSGGNRFAWYFNERWDSQMIQSLTVLEQSESKLRLVICLKKAPTPLWQEYRSLREIGTKAETKAEKKACRPIRDRGLATIAFGIHSIGTGECRSSSSHVL